MIIGAGKGQKCIILGIDFCHAVFQFCPVGIIHFHTVHIPGEKPDMINIPCLPVGMGLDDQRSAIGHIGKFFPGGHIHDLPVFQVPVLIQAVDEKICAGGNGEFYAEKYLQTDLVANGFCRLIIGTVEV